MAGGGMEARNIGFGGGMPEPPLPPDASNTLFIEGIPTDCARREVSRILKSHAFFCLSLIFHLHKLWCKLFIICLHLLAAGPSPSPKISSDHLLVFVR